MGHPQGLLAPSIDYLCAAIPKTPLEELIHGPMDPDYLNVYVLKVI